MPGLAGRERSQELGWRPWYGSLATLRDTLKPHRQDGS